jgi:hypothetical protein
MSDQSLSTGSNDPFLPILGAVLLLLILGALGWILIVQPEPPALTPDARIDFAKQFFVEDQIGFAPIEVDTERIARERAALPAPERPSGDQYSRISTAYKALSTEEVKGGSSTNVEVAGRAFVVAGREIFGRHGSAGIYGAIDIAYPDFRAALTHISTASRDLGIPPERLVTDPPADLKDAIAWAGGFVILARRLGLMSPTGVIPERLDPVVEIFFRYRWINSCRGPVVPQTLLTPTEFITLNLWRLHEARNIGEKRRHKYVINLGAAIRGYPGDAADGVVYFQHGRLQTARRSFQTSMANKDIAPVMERYITLLDAIQTAPIRRRPTPDAAQIPPAKPDAGPPQPNPNQP